MNGASFTATLTSRHLISVAASAIGRCFDTTSIAPGESWVERIERGMSLEQPAKEWIAPEQTEHR